MAELDFSQTEPAKDLGYHTMSGEYFLQALRRCYQGEDPDMVYAEMYANSVRERIDPEDSDVA